MTAIVRLGNGKEVVISSDLGQIRLSIWANCGSLGTGLTPEQAMEAGWALFTAGRRTKKESVAAQTFSSPEQSDR